MSSSLNPEAPEFYPSVLLQDGYGKVNKAVRSSQILPCDSSFNIFKTFTDFNVVSSNLSENVTEQANQLLFSELGGPKLKGNDNKDNIEKIIDANDNILERVNINTDSTIGVNSESQKYMKSIQSPIISQIKVGSTMFTGASNIPRPQLMFKDTIDNSENLWLPKISDKPNSITPLALKILYDDNGKAVGYEHPYCTELNLYHPCEEFIEPNPEPPIFPSSLEETQFSFVNTEAQLDELVEHLYSVRELAVDLEQHRYRSYQGITCLMQISTDEGGDFIIDTLAIREHIHKLNVIFTDPKKLKVFHGADNDVLWLQRDFGVYLVGLFDTYQAATVLKLPKLSLKYLLMKYCNIDVDKTYQMADWRIRPLSEALLKYARTDTHYLLYVWRIMKSELLNLGNGLSHQLCVVFEKSASICQRTYIKAVIHETSHIQLYLQSKKIFTVRQMTALKMLFKWRDARARELDESAHYLIPNHTLLKIVEELPREVQGILACFESRSPFLKQNLNTIHKMMLSCLELPNQPYVHVSSANKRLDFISERQPKLVDNLHDLPHSSKDSNNSITLHDYNINLFNFDHFESDLQVFKTTTNEKVGTTIVSNLNAEAEIFIPPYDRYRKYRCLIQMSEINDFKERESKVFLFGGGNELIHKEIIEKLQQAQTQIVEEDNPTASPSSTADNKVQDKDQKIAQQRKRKMSSVKHEKNKIIKSVIDKKLNSVSKVSEIKTKG